MQRIRRSQLGLTIALTLTFGAGAARVEGQEPGTPATPAAPTPPEPDERAAKLRAWVADLAGGDAAKAEVAHAELLRAGPEALPALKEALEATGTDRVVKTIDQILLLQSAEKADFWGPTLGPEDLPKGERPVPPAAQDRRAAEAYVSSRLAWAREQFDQGRFAAALGIVESLLTLEPTSTQAADMKALRLLCKARLFNEGVLRAEAVGPSEVLEAGDVATVFFRLTNSGAAAVEIRFGAGAGDAGGRLLARGLFTVLDQRGSSRSETRAYEAEVAGPISLAPGQSLEIPVTVDTAADADEHPDLVKTYTLVGSLPGGRVFVDGVERAQRIAFEPLRIAVFPPGTKVHAKAPLLSLARALDEGTVSDVFRLALLLPEEDKPKGAALMIKALETVDEEGAQFVMLCLRHLTGNEALGSDRERWLSWWKARQGNER